MITKQKLKQINPRNSLGARRAITISYDDIVRKQKAEMKFLSDNLSYQYNKHRFYKYGVTHDKIKTNHKKCEQICRQYKKHLIQKKKN